jgi:hypothetical protein
VRGVAFVMLAPATQPFVPVSSAAAQKASPSTQVRGHWLGSAERHHHLMICRGGLPTPQCRDLDVVLRHNLRAPAMLIERS